MNRNQAAQLLPTFMNKKHICAAVGVGNNKMLVAEILKNFTKAVNQTKRIAFKFKGENFNASAENVWNFLKKEITYQEDGGLLQLMKLPSALIATGKGDCKSYSLFSAGVMANLGSQIEFIFAGYNGATYPGHVYIIANNGNETRIIDAVYNKFNSEKKPYTYYKKYKMEISTISGINCANCQDPIGKINLKKSVDKAAAVLRNKKQQLEKYAKTKIKPALKKVFDLEKKAVIMLPRVAFLQLVKLNVHHFALRLSQDRTKSLAIWSKLGGNKGELNASINAGLKRKPILGIQGIGVVGTSVAAILLAAAPIIATFAAILNSNKGDKTKDPGSTNSVTDIIDSAANFVNSTKTENYNTDGENSGGKYEGGGSPQPPIDPPTATGSKWLLPVAIIAAILIIK